MRGARARAARRVHRAMLPLALLHQGLGAVVVSHHPDKRVVMLQQGLGAGVLSHCPEWQEELLQQGLL